MYQGKKNGRGQFQCRPCPATLVDNDSCDPKNWAEAMASKNKEEWEQGLTKELKSIEERQVWMLVTPSEVPKGWKIIGCRPVCHIKWNSKGETMEHKVRLMVQGFTQVAGIDYTNTFAPVA